MFQPFDNLILLLLRQFLKFVKRQVKMLYGLLLTPFLC